MLTARRAVALIIGLAIVSIAAAVYNLSKPPDAGGMGSNSYGTRAHGHRALYETLERLQVPVKRTLVPPPLEVSIKDRLAIIAPRQDLVENEPEHLRRTAKWIMNGGNAVVALSADSDDHRGNNLKAPAWDNDVLKELGLPGIRLVRINPKAEAVGAAEMATDEERARRQQISTVKVSDERKIGRIPATTSESLTYLENDVRELWLPREDLQVLEVTTATPAMTGAVTLEAADGVGYTLVAVFLRGRGQVTVLTDSDLLNNHLLDKGDNSVLAANLFGQQKRAVAFDEFYHGLMTRGNPLWLLRQPRYALLFIFCVLGVGLWWWRQAAVLGPPIPPRELSRRTLAEYLDAMAVLFTRSKQNRFLLQELQKSIVWALRERLHLPPQKENLDAVVSALERHDPDKAVQLRAASQRIDHLLTTRQTINDSQFIEAARELNKCL